MNYFDGLSNNLFKKDSNGNLIYFPWGIFGKGYIKLANFLLGLTISDFTCGFKCYRLEAAQKVFSRQRLMNWSFDAEDIFIAKKHGCTIKEIPVYWKHTGGSKVKVLKNVIVCGWDLILIKYYNLRGKYS